MLWDSQTTECHSAIQRNKVLTHETTRAGLPIWHSRHSAQAHENVLISSKSGEKNELLG